MNMSEEISNTNVIEDQLTPKRPLVIAANTDHGHVQINGQVASLGGHHFRIQTEKNVSPRLFAPQQKVKVRLMGQASTLPMTCRFLRVDKNKPNQIVLSMPEGEWITNRRAFARAPIELEFKAVRNNGEELYGTTTDISGGGVLLCFENDVSIPAGEEVELHLYQRVGQRTDTLKFVARMVREQMMGENRNFGMKFVNARSREQNRLCKMVIVEQFEQRRQELREISGRNNENQ
jgi:c-di-GMP-binding flagellar brake protein YcgR